MTLQEVIEKGVRDGLIPEGATADKILYYLFEMLFKQQGELVTLLKDIGSALDITAEMLGDRKKESQLILDLLQQHKGRVEDECDE